MTKLAHGYVRSIKKNDFADCCIGGLKSLKINEFTRKIVANQAGIARRYYSIFVFRDFITLKKPFYINSKKVRKVCCLTNEDHDCYLICMGYHSTAVVGIVVCVSKSFHLKPLKELW